jgi:ABC-type antimicrobial peptide transport system permease subunit
VSGSSGGQVWRVARYRNRATFRRRAGGYVALVLLIGLLGGLAMASVAAARSTQSSFPRFMRSTNPSDLDVVDLAAAQGQRASNLLPTLERLPHVKRVATWGAPNTARLKADGTPVVASSADSGGVFPVVSANGLFTRQDKATVVQGRALNPARSDEIEASAIAAETLHLRVGGSARVGFYTSVEATEPGFGTSPSIRPVFTETLHLVGIVKFNNAVVQDEIDRLPTFILYNPKLAKRLIACCGAGGLFAGVQLDHGARDVPAVEAEIAHALPGVVITSITSVQISKAERAVEPESIALGVFGGIAALAALLVAGQMIGRQLRLAADQRAVLRALGASPATVIADGLIGLVAVIVVGALLAVALATALSPLAPLGPVHSVVRSHVTFDWTVLGCGALGLVGLLVAIATVLALLGAPHRVARHRRARAASSWVHAATGTGFSPAAVTGVTFAVEPGSGANAAPVRSAIVGGALAVVVLVATLVFGASLGTLVRKPALYGWNWSYELRSGYGGISNIPSKEALPILQRDPLIAAYTPVFYATLQVGSLTVPVLGAPPSAAIGPSLLSGHDVQAPNQMVVAPDTLADLQAHLGDTITVGSGKNEKHLQIVGTAALPAVGVATNLHLELATGAVVATSVIAPGDRGFGDHDGPEAYLVRLKPGVASTRAVADLRRDASGMSHSPGDGPVTVLPVQRPAEIVNYRTMGTTPALLGGGLALGAVAALGLTLVASVRRRRRDLALLKTLGFTRRQLAAVVAWQASVAAVIGAIVGVPLGVVVGRELWNRFATAIHVVPQPTVPALSLLLVGVGAIVVANLVAAWPGSRAARTTTAVLLRAE